MRLESLHFLSAGRIAPNPNWRMAAHSHPHHEMIVVMRGRMEVEIAGRTLCARSGDVLFYPKETLHTERSDAASPVETLFVVFAGDRVTDLPLQVNDLDGRIRILVNWLYVERDSYAPNAGSMRDTLLRALVAEYIRLCSGRRHPLVEEIRGFVRAHLADSITLDQLAARAGGAPCQSDPPETRSPASRAA